MVNTRLLMHTRLSWILFVSLSVVILSPPAQYALVFLVLVSLARKSLVHGPQWFKSNTFHEMPHFIWFTAFAMFGSLLLTLISTLLAEFVDASNPDFLGIFRSFLHLVLKRFLVWLVLVYGLKQILEDRSLADIFPVFAVFLGLYTAYAVLQRYTGVDLANGLTARLGQHRFAYGTFRVSGLMGHPISLSYNLMLLFFFCLSMVKRSGLSLQQYRSIWTSIGLVIVLLFLSGSRWPVAVCGMVLAITEARRLLHLWKYVLVGASGLASALVLEGTLLSRVTELWQQIQNHQVPRFEFWRIHWQIFLDHPWWGTGYVRYKEVAARYYEAAQISGLNERYNAHNIYLQTLADGGVMATTGLLAFLCVITLGGWALRRRSLLLLQVSLCTILGGLMQNVLRDSTYLYALSLMLALFFAESFKEEKRSSL